MASTAFAYLLLGIAAWLLWIVIHTAFPTIGEPVNDVDGPVGRLYKAIGIHIRNIDSSTLRVCASGTAGLAQSLLVASFFVSHHAPLFNVNMCILVYTMLYLIAHEISRNFRRFRS